jgi:hypothetical protein
MASCLVLSQLNHTHFDACPGKSSNVLGNAPYFSREIDKGHLFYVILSFLDELHIRHDIQKIRLRMMK